MACRDDPVACIDFAALFIGEFLKDGTTLALLTVLLGLTIKLRRDRQRAAQQAYDAQLLVLAAQREEAGHRAPGWIIGDKTRTTP
jgi:hypothetical protein